MASWLKRSNVVLCLTTEHDSALVPALEDAGFQPDSRYAMLAKRLTKPIAKLANESASEAVPVS